MTNRKRPAPKWRAAFLRALARSGNVRLAAELAGVDHSSAYYQRRADARFAAAWARALRRGSGHAAERGRAAVMTGQATTSTGAARRPLHRSRHGGHGPPPLGRRGEDLVVRVSKNAGAQLVRAGEGRWSEAMEDAFLSALADNPNVKAAARTVGISTCALYRRHASDTGFRARWATALAMGYARIEALMVDAAERALDPERLAEPPELPRTTIAEAITIWRNRPKEAAVAATAEPSIEEVREEVLRRLAAIRAAGQGE